MAGGFFALLDDVASLLDDVAAMTKIATKKTAGVRRKFSKIYLRRRLHFWVEAEILFVMRGRVNLADLAAEFVCVF